jgi:protein-tyrosine phosphatase
MVMSFAVFRRATETDLPMLVALRDAAARWMAGAGIDQWRPGERTEEDFRAAMSEAEVWVATRGSGGRIAGTFELWWDDERTWGLQPPHAGYIHRLMIDHENPLRGTGRAMLGAAESRIAETGRHLARLDCAAHNLRLRRYYTDAGYREVGHQHNRLGSRYPVTLFEKSL